MWDRVYCKKTPCWLWHAINPDNGDIVAYVFGTRKSEVLKEFWVLLNGLNLDVVGVFSDDIFAYHEIMPKAILHTGKRNTQCIERKHLMFRTWLKCLACRAICYSKSTGMYVIVFGLLINVLEFGNKLC
ncbi:MAG: IS1 family transposase [Nitrososphaerota archaeon]|nr:IS1 family transposase [Nitrososphaerota archaeon]